VLTSTASPGGELIEDGAVAIADGRVVAVGSYPDVRKRYRSHQELGSSRHLVMPGLVNSHHHGWGLSPFQLGAPDGYLEPWMMDLMATRPVDPYLNALQAGMRLARSGVTTVQHAALPHDPGRAADETRAALRAYDDLGLRVAYGVPVQDRNTFVYRDDEDFLSSLPAELADSIRSAMAGVELPTVDDFRELVDELGLAYRDHPRVSLVLCPQGPEWCSDELLLELRALADEKGMFIHMHFLESPFQREFLRREKGQRATMWLDQIGFLGPDVSLSHAVWMDRQEIELCAKREVSLCHNPSSNLRLRVGIFPLMPMLAAGVNVALGMDGTTLNEDDDMLQEMRLAAKLHRLPTGLAPVEAPSAQDLLRMSTLNGARAIGLQDEIGSLEPGKRADAVLVDYEAACGAYVHPDVNPLDVILQRARGTDVDHVIVEGEVIVSGGQPTRVDADQVAEDLARSATTALEPRTEAWIKALRAVRPYVASFYSDWPEPNLDPIYKLNSLD